MPEASLDTPPSRARRCARRLCTAALAAAGSIWCSALAHAADPVPVTLTTVGCTDREQTSRLNHGRIYRGRKEAVELQAQAIASGNCILISQGTRVRPVELNANLGLVCAVPVNRPRSGCYWINDTLIIAHERIGWR